MRIDYLEVKGTWREVADSARTTIGMDKGKGKPGKKWKYKILLSEHSPIRQLIMKWKWCDLPYWVSVHFVRHKIGIEHFVSTQRSDRTGVNRDRLPQAQLVSHECVANAQAVINISRKRLCTQASQETGKAWNALLAAVKKQLPELYDVCVPECVYRGFCPEINSCGWIDTNSFRERLSSYRKLSLS
ncbi:MAG: hypothetical protein PVG39_28350 [Desulfobacteraceae bacterium]|jgi:hypothetical protein